MANKLKKAQVTIEFALAFMLTILFVVLTAKVLAWMGGSIIKRHKAYENSRTIVGCPGNQANCTMNLTDKFYDESANKMDLFKK